MDEKDAELLSRFLFRRPKRGQIFRLSIGAPSSPMLSNILMYDFDKEISLIASSKGLNYSRYADDLTFSGQRIGILNDMVRAVKLVLRQMRSPKLRVNEKKTVFATLANRRLVTGIVIANDGTAGLGRERKRKISAGVHRATLGALPEAELRALCGQLAFVKSVEPEFLEKLAARYGPDSIRKIQMAVQRNL